MLTPVEQMLFILLSLLAVGATLAGFWEMYRIVNRGEGKLYLDNLPVRAWNALVIYLTQRTTLKTRRVTSLFHLAVVWGFTFYFLVNFGDVLEGFFPGYVFLGNLGLIHDAYRLTADVFSVAVLVGVTYLILRRWVLPARKQLQFHDNVLLHPKVKAGGIGQDSLIVAGFISSVNRLKWQNTGRICFSRLPRWYHRCSCGPMPMVWRCCITCSGGWRSVAF
jgi:hypothetical protein